MIGNWLQNRRQKQAERIAYEVRQQLELTQWDEILPPVAVRDTVFVMSKNGHMFTVENAFNPETTTISKLGQIRPV